jgi:hypothetical protein
MKNVSTNSQLSHNKSDKVILRLLTKNSKMKIAGRKMVVIHMEWEAVVFASIGGLKVFLI